MSTYRAMLVINKPTYVQIEVEADSVLEAEDRATELLAEHTGKDSIFPFAQLYGTSGEQYDTDSIEVMDVDEVRA